MSGYNIISRASLYESDQEHGSEQEALDVYMPNIEFDFVEVDDESEAVDKSQTMNTKESLSAKVLEGKDNDEDNEFDFPLFSATLNTVSNENTEEKREEDRGRSRTVGSLMKVSLREESVEKIVNERPSSFYFASYTKEQKGNFQSVAITANEIHNELNICKSIDPTPWKCVDLKAHKSNIEHISNAKSRNKKSKRPGKKKRENIIETRKRVEERRIIASKIEKEKMAKLKKKMFHKRGGKKHKKTNSSKEDTKSKNKTK